MVRGIYHITAEASLMAKNPQVLIHSWQFLREADTTGLSDNNPQGTKSPKVFNTTHLYKDLLQLSLQI